MDDSVMPEGLTLRPPDPPIFGEEGDAAASATDKQVWPVWVVITCLP